MTRKCRLSPLAPAPGCLTLIDRFPGVFDPGLDSVPPPGVFCNLRRPAMPAEVQGSLAGSPGVDPGGIIDRSQGSKTPGGASTTACTPEAVPAIEFCNYLESLSHRVVGQLGNWAVDAISRIPACCKGTRSSAGPAVLAPAHEHYKPSANGAAQASLGQAGARGSLSAEGARNPQAEASP